VCAAGECDRFPLTIDFTNAATAQLRDAQGQIVLQGDFMPPVDEDGDAERRASLTATGADADAVGEAEIEFAEQAPSELEIEFSARNLQPGGTFTFVIDGTDVVSAVADRRGEAEAEVEVSIP
jgi:hypothetical protein